jgi:hypothetical protein
MATGLSPQELDELKSLLGSQGAPAPVQPTSVMEGAKQPGKTFTDLAIEALPDIGGLAGGVIGAATTRTPQGAMTGRALAQQAVRGVIGSGLGAATGTALESGVKTAMGMPVPLTKTAADMLSNSVTNMALDATGNVVFNMLGKGYRVTKDALLKAGVLPPMDTSAQEAKRVAQELLQKYGGSLTEYQITGTTGAKVRESVGRSGFSGQSTFDQLAETNLNALRQERDKILDTVSDEAITAIAAGKSVRDIIQGSNEKLSQLTNPFYEVILPSRGVNIPVDLTSVQKYATDKLTEAAKPTKTGEPEVVLGSAVSGVLNDIQKFADSVSFADAQKLRSMLTTRLRDVQVEFGKQSPVAYHLRQTIGNIDAVMDTAAKQLDPDLLSQYRSTQKFYRESLEKLFPETVLKILVKEPERIGEAIYKAGNQSEIRAIKDALAQAKTIDPSIDIKSVQQALNRGYVESFLGEQGAENTLKEFVAIGTKLRKDANFRRTFEEALSPEAQNSIRALSKTAEISSKTPGGSLSLFVTGKQAEAVSSLAAVLAGSGAASLSQDPLLGAAVGAGVLLTPKVFAKIATNPKAASQLVGLEKEISKAGMTGAAAAKLAKIYNDARVTTSDFGTPETATQDQPPQGLTPEQMDELRNLTQPPSQPEKKQPMKQSSIVGDLLGGFINV